MSFRLLRMLRNLLLFGASLAAASASAQTAAFQNCYARWSATELTVGNTHFERRWQIRNGHLYATSFQDRDAHKEWLAAADNKGGYLLLFREANSSAQWTTPLPFGVSANAKLTVLAGKGAATIQNGAAAVTIATPLGYLWVRFDSK